MKKIEIQMYRETAPFKRTRYYQSGIDMSILEKGKPYHGLPDVTVIYLTKEDFIGDKRGCYNIYRKPEGQDVTMRLENGLHEKYYNLEYPTDDMRVNELLRYFCHSDPFYKTEKYLSGDRPGTAGKVAQMCGQSSGYGGI